MDSASLELRVERIDNGSATVYGHDGQDTDGHAQRYVIERVDQFTAYQAEGPVPVTT